MTDNNGLGIFTDWITLRMVARLALLLAVQAWLDAVSAGSWDAISTVLLEPVLIGERQLVVRECREIAVGSRLRLSLGQSSEEEGAVADLACPSPGMGRHDATARRKVDYAILEAAGSDVGGGGPVEAGRKHTAVASEAAATALQPVVLSMASATDERHGPGVVTLAADLLYAHPRDTPVRGTAALTSEQIAAAFMCPAGQNGEACSGPEHGSCELTTCVCEAGWGGPDCSVTLGDCEPGCGSHGECVRGAEGSLGAVCVCHSGWQGAACSEAKCEGDCSGRGALRLAACEAFALLGCHAVRALLVAHCHTYCPTTPPLPLA